MIVYRSDRDQFPDGHVIFPRGDCIGMLNKHRRQAELAIRAAMPDGVRVRSTSLYTWHDKEVAIRAAEAEGKHLYELEVDPADVRFIGDLNYYSEAADWASLGMNERVREAAEKYCSGAFSNPNPAEQRIEILISKAKVLRKLR